MSTSRFVQIRGRLWLKYNYADTVALGANGEDGT